VHGHDTHAKVRRELKIISSLNCLGYIKFDFVCDLNSLENELFQKSGLLYLDYCTFMQLVYMIITIDTLCRRYIFVQI
jgi:hypothetical protein